jgi:hypothetical protein
MHADPILRLCANLYSEALAEPSPDVRYFRVWSTLETLSGARVPSGQPVFRNDGTPWPNGETTNQAAPRVYRLIADWLSTRNIDEASTVDPAPDLYEAVEGWYGPRNATGHYGRSDPGDTRQAAQRWFPWAQLTVPAPSDPFDRWLMALQRSQLTRSAGNSSQLVSTRSRDVREK